MNSLLKTVLDLGPYMAVSIFTQWENYVLNKEKCWYQVHKYLQYTQHFRLLFVVELCNDGSFSTIFSHT